MLQHRITVRDATVHVIYGPVCASVLAHCFGLLSHPAHLTNLTHQIHPKYLTYPSHPIPFVMAIVLSNVTVF